MVADLPMPKVQIEASDAPLSWTTAFPTRSPTLHVTTGLLEKATDDQLSAVVAHEVSHIAQRDAWLMTLVGALPAWMILGNRQAEQRAIEQDGEDSWNHGVQIMFGYLTSALVAPGLLASRIFSRYRELSADRGAAALTGSPSAVAATLLALSQALGRIARADLRTLAARDPFHLLPVAPERSGLRRLWATHPSLSQRLEQLERMEESLHAARPRLASDPETRAPRPGPRRTA